MAGGGELGGGGGRPKRGKHSKRKPKKRLGFRIDMTPLVDITFFAFDILHVCYNFNHTTSDGYGCSSRN